MSAHGPGCELCDTIRDALCEQGPCTIDELERHAALRGHDLPVGMLGSHLLTNPSFEDTRPFSSRLPTLAGVRPSDDPLWAYRPPVTLTLYSPRLGPLGRLVCSTEHEPRRRIGVVFVGFVLGAIIPLVVGASAVAVAALGLSAAAALALVVQRFAQDPVHSIGPGTKMSGAGWSRATLHVAHVAHLLDTAGPDAAELAWYAAVGEFGVIASNDELEALVVAAARADAAHAGVSASAAHLALELFDGDAPLAASLASAATGEDPELIERWLHSGCGTIDRTRCWACAQVPAGRAIWPVTIGRQPE